MAENSGTAAAQTGDASASTAAQTAPQQFSVPSGYQLVRNEDHQRYTSYENQVRGFKPLYDRLAKSGIKSADDWAKYEPDFQTISKRGLKPGSIASMFSEDADKDLGGGDSKPQNIDLDKLRAEIKSEASAELHTILYDRERENDPKAVEAALVKVIGEGEHGALAKDLTKRAVNDYLYEIRGVYEDGPLKGRPKPLTSEMTEKAIKYFADLKASEAARDTADAAERAAAPVKKTSSAAGGGASSTGKPTTSPRDRHTNRPTDDEISAEIAITQASRRR